MKKSKKIVWVFGNLDLRIDSLPLHLVEHLAPDLPNIEFKIKNPLEEWDDMPQDELIILDTIINISGVKIFDKIEDFSLAPSFTMHDFDLLSQLNFLKKLGKLPPKIKIVGLGPTIDEKEALEKLRTIFQSI